MTERTILSPHRATGPSSWRVAACSVGLFVAVTAVLLVGLDITWAWRPYVVAALFMTVPGLALWGRAPLDDDPALWATVVIATSVIVSSALGLGLVWARSWHPDTAAVALGATCAVVLFRALTRRDPDGDFGG